MMDFSILIDDITKIVSAGCGLATLYLAYQKILPRLEEIHSQTNSLAIKAEAGARAEGIQEGLKQASEIDPAVAAAAKLVLDAAAERAASLLAVTAERAKRS